MVLRNENHCFLTEEKKTFHHLMNEKGMQRKHFLLPVFFPYVEYTSSVFNYNVSLTSAHCLEIKATHSIDLKKKKQCLTSTGLSKLVH